MSGWKGKIPPNQQPQLPGQPDRVTAGKDWFEILPLTVWELPQADPLEWELKRAIGDKGVKRLVKGPCHFAVDPRIGSRHRAEELAKETGGEETQGVSSVFSPKTASLLLRMYAPKEGVCFDPFAGGGTRAIMAAKHGLDYVGLELRPEGVKETIARCQANDVIDKVRIYQGDAQLCTAIPDNSADFIITCPPYWNLEQYEGGENDLSMAPTYEAFLEMYRHVIFHTFRILKPGAVSCWVVGLCRDKDKQLVPIHHDTARLHKVFGFWMKEEIILYRKGGAALTRVGTFHKGNHLLLRVHEYAQIYVKPKGKK
jgi:hypothetical protein